MGKENFNQWLSTGKSGIEVLEQHLARKGLTGLSREQMQAFCSALIDLGLDLNVSRLRKARERLRNSGVRCDGRIPFGSTAEEGTILRQMMEMRDRGETYRAITAQLNLNKATSRMGGEWKNGTVAKILKRERDSLNRK